MNGIKQLLFRRRLNQDLADEIQAHLSEKVDELVAGGMSRDDAVLAARRKFGNVPLIEETGREVWRWTFMEDLLLDIRFAFRKFLKSPAFALATVLTLALGIGFNTAMFSVVNAVVLRPLPYPEADKLVSVQSRHLSGAAFQLCYPTFFDFRNGSNVFDHIVSYRDSDLVLTDRERPVRLRGAIVSWDLFPLLRVQPAVGRGFLAAEEQAGVRVAVLSYETWKARFDSDQGIAGRTISIDRMPYTVVGVAPEGFSFPITGQPVEIWTTLAVDAASATVHPITRQRGARQLYATARLKQGVSIEQARSRMDAIAASVAQQYPDHNKSIPGAYVRPELERLTGDVRRPMLILLAAVGLVLLVACANIANLLLARTSEREHEFSLRAAIGAGRGRLIRQVVAESLTLSVAGCAAGVVAAAGLLRLVLPLAAGRIPRIDQAVIDTRVILFSTGLAVLTGVLFSLVPALRLAKLELAGSLKESSRSTTQGTNRFRSGLVAAQIAIGLVLLSSASLLIAGFMHLMTRDVGFQPERILAFEVMLPQSEYPGPKQLQFYSRLLERLNSLPGVAYSATAMPLPLTGSRMRIAFNIEERPAPPGERPRSDMAIVSPGFFRTLGVPILQGREFNDRDSGDAPPVLVVNLAFADKFFPGQNAVGKRIEPGAIADNRGTRMREIIGVIGNARQSPVTQDSEPIYYFPYQQLPWCCPSVVVRSAASPSAIESSISGAVASLDRYLPVYQVRTLDRELSAAVTVPRIQVILLGSFAALALMLTAIGLYGVLAYSVTKQTREIGVRIALGASRRIVVRMVLGKAALITLIGVSIGLAGAAAASRLLSQALYGVTSVNPVLLAIACVVVVFTAAAAAYLPARRAASIDPVQAMRAD